MNRNVIKGVLLITVCGVAAGLWQWSVRTPPAGPAPAITPAEPPPRAVRHITVAGAGDRAGADLANAGRLEDLPDLVAASEPGDEVWIHGGSYAQDGPVAITSGGAPGHPVVVRGVDGRPELVGSRADPYRAGGAKGKEVFRLLDGADHLRFVNLGFRNQGNGCFRIGADIADLAITDVTAVNVARLVENTASGERDSATVTGLTVTDATVRGYSEGAVRLRYDSSAVLLADLEGDAQAQEQSGDDFPIGVALDDTVHEVELRRVTMRNHRSERANDEYWNGDGFTAEGGTYDLTYVDTYAAGNSDAGYDLKSTGATLLRAVAEDNGRNFRFWGEGIAVRDCVGRSPHRRGGSTTQAQVHGSGATDTVLTACTFDDADGGTIVFDVDEGEVRIEGGSVRHAREARLQAVEEGASLALAEVEVVPIP